MANPTLLKTPIASGGDKNTIPETTGSITGLLSQEKGWQQINSLPINAGGIAPSRLDFNGVFNLLSNILFYTQKGWVWEFDEGQAYYVGCTVKDTADGKTYVCIDDVNASTTHPSSDTTHWKLSDLATKDDLANYLPLAGGSMTGNTISRNADNAELFLRGGSGSGGGFIQLCGPTRSGTAGNFYIIANDGTNYARLIGSATGSNTGTLTWCGHNVLTDANGGYLPLAGGAMTGTTIKRGVTNSLLNIMSGTDWNEGAYLELYGKDRSGTDGFGETKGCFILSAENGTDEVRLVGQPNLGQLLFRVVENGLSKGYNDLGGSAIVAKSLTPNGYVKFADGRIRQWGYVTPSGSDVTDVSVSFPISFPNACFGVYEQSVGTLPTDGAMMWRQINSVTTSGFKFSRMGTVAETGKYWFAIGY